jgi:uncharacterized protein (DUF488 family)
MSSAATHPVFTIGHSNHKIDAFLRLLVMHGITAVADVRSQPYSRLHPQFNRETLKGALRARNIAYVFLGRELGARSEDMSCYVRGVVQYDRLANTAPFQDGLGRVMKGSRKYRIALLCAERDPLTCHRTILVGRELAARGVQLMHIRADGTIETQADAVARLLVESKLHGSELFRSPNDIEIDAYARRASEIAYRINNTSSTTSMEGK